jgi:GAF domain-containing protein
VAEGAPAPGSSNRKAKTVVDTSNKRPVDAEQAMRQLSTLTLREHSMHTLLQAVVDTATSTLPGHLEASISLIVRGKPATAVYTGQLALDLDEAQYGHGHGPCLHAAISGELVEIGDARADARWPDYMTRAVERGSLSSLSVPLSMDDLHGGMNIYAREAHAFDEDARATATRFAPYAAVAINNMNAYQSAREMADNLEIALQSRAVIDQAKGILIERHKLTPDQAFQALARASQQANRKLRDIADHLVQTGELGL